MSDVPDGLDARGSALWVALEDRTAGDPVARELLVEACRVVDRLEGLDRILRGERHDLLTVAVDDVGEYRFYVDEALAESRRQAMVLRQLLGSLPAKEADDGDDDWLSDLPGVPTEVRNTAN